LIKCAHTVVALYNCCLLGSIEDITDQFLINDPLGRNVISITSNSIIQNNFFRYDFSGYDLRSDQIIDFGEDPENQTLTFNTYIGTDWLDAARSHYFEVTYWKESKTFEETVSGPSWFSNYHYNRAAKHEEYFFNSSSMPSYLIISWEESDFKAGGFRDFYYSLLIDGTTEGHRSFDHSLSNPKAKPWLKVSMQSIVGLGSNLSIAEQIVLISEIIKDVANKITITGGSSSPQLDLNQFQEAATNSSPHNFISSDALGNSWNSSSWFGDFYKPKLGLIFHSKLGWLHYGSYDAISSWCWHPSLSWFWVSESTFPHIYLSTKQWGYLDLRGGNPLIYDYNKNIWIGIDQLVFSSNDSLSQRLYKIYHSFFSEAKKKELIARYLVLGE